MKILCIGRNGQIARALSERATVHGVSLVAKGRPDLDMLVPDSVKRAIDATEPDLIVNAAAYTGVDAAESNQDQAHALNAVAPGLIASMAAKAGIPLLHYSTDYVFDGGLDRPYEETDPIAPLGVYGHTKALGEQAVIEHCDQHLIFRTAWVYSPFGSNFVKTMLRLAKTRDEISVVDDQIGNPSSAFDLADATLRVCRATLDQDQSARWGLYHMAGTGSASWAGFAEAIFRHSVQRGGPGASVSPILSDAYPTAVERPANSCLSTTKLSSAFGIILPNWQTSLGATVQRLVTEGVGPQ